MAFDEERLEGPLAVNPLDNIRVVLVGTLYAGNVGSSCRAMANMGIRHLRLAAPNLQSGWEEATRMAVHATDILEAREEFATFEEAVADCVAVVGTTAREGLYRQHVKAPGDCAADIVALAATGPVAIVFGREDKGLVNEEIAQCTHLVRIPVDEGYKSINLSQAVLITCYELFKASGRYVPPHEKAPPAPQAQKMQLVKNWAKMLIEIGFMKPEQEDHFMQGFHRVFSRGVVTKDDAALMLGVARQAIWAKGSAIMRGLAAALLMLTAVAGCRTNKDILNDYEKAMVAGDYASPVQEIEEKAADGGVDELLWRLHAGCSRYLMNDFQAAVGQFDKAEDVFIRNDHVSVFDQGATGALAMMSNDRVFPYAGGGEDRIFACFYKAVDYARSGKIDSARTELNRAAQHQDNWLWERQSEIAAAKKKLDEDADAYAKKEGGGANSGAEASKAVDGAFSNASFAAQVAAKCDFDMASGGDTATMARKDWLNRYVQYATGIFRWAAGDGDGAAFLKEISEIDTENSLFKADYAAAAGGQVPRNNVWIFVEDGLGPVREEWRLDLPTILIPYANRYVMYAGMALPYLRYRSAGHTSYSAAAGGSVAQLAEIQDVDRLVKTEFDVYFRGALVREITRTVVKIGVQVALGVTAENASDSSTKFALRASQVAAAAWAASVTQADLRIWTGLPKKVYAARVARPADGRIVLAAGGGAPVAEITVPEGNTLVFVRKPSAMAPAVVKSVTLPNIP